MSRPNAINIESVSIISAVASSRVLNDPQYSRDRPHSTYVLTARSLGWSRVFSSLSMIAGRDEL